jgi:hypothetical protein
MTRDEVSDRVATLAIASDLLAPDDRKGPSRLHVRGARHGIRRDGAR